MHSLFFSLFIYVGVFACMRVCALHVSCDHSGQKRASDPLELDLQMVASYGVGNE